MAAASCGRPCAKQLSCGHKEHQCKLPCHTGPCDPCTHTERQRCYCGSREEQRRCGEGVAEGGPPGAILRGASTSSDINPRDKSDRTASTNEAVVATVNSSKEVLDSDHPATRKEAAISAGAVLCEINPPQIRKEEEAEAVAVAVKEQSILGAGADVEETPCLGALQPQLFLAEDDGWDDEDDEEWDDSDETEADGAEIANDLNRVDVAYDVEETVELLNCQQEREGKEESESAVVDASPEHEPVVSGVEAYSAGKHPAPLLVGHFSCDGVCGHSLPCGHHLCTRSCHIGDCGDCPFDPRLVE